MGPVMFMSKCLIFSFFLLLWILQPIRSIITSGMLRIVMAVVWICPPSLLKNWTISPQNTRSTMQYVDLHTNQFLSLVVTIVKYYMIFIKKSIFLLCRTHSQWRFRSCQGRLCTYPHRVHLFYAVSQRSCMGFCFLSFWPPRTWAPSTATLHPANYLLGPPASARVCLYMVYFFCMLH